MAADLERKKEWDRKNMVFIGVKLFRKIGEKENDQEIIDFLQAQPSMGMACKDALRFYMNYLKTKEEENKK